MTTLRIGLVTEGPTDQVVLDHILKFHFKEIRPDINLVIRNLQPIRDATSGRIDGGWTQVYKWCVRNRNSNGPARVSRPLFSNGLDSYVNDYTVIQIDSDIIDEITVRPPNAKLPTRSCTSMLRGRFIRRTIVHWLWPAGPRDPKYIPLACVEAIEAWLVAGVQTNTKPESNHNIQEELGMLEAKLRGKSNIKPGRKMKKTIKNYRNFCREFISSTQNLHQNCFQFRRLIRDLKV